MITQKQIEAELPFIKNMWKSSGIKIPDIPLEEELYERKVERHNAEYYENKIKIHEDKINTLKMEMKEYLKKYPWAGTWSLHFTLSVDNRSEEQKEIDEEKSKISSWYIKNEFKIKDLFKRQIRFMKKLFMLKKYGHSNFRAHYKKDEESEEFFKSIKKIEFSFFKELSDLE